jgi:hypothetical protein
MGCLIALPANGMTSAAGGTNFSEIWFAFRISGTSLVVGMVLAVLMAPEDRNLGHRRASAGENANLGCLASGKLASS